MLKYQFGLVAFITLSAVSTISQAAETTAAVVSHAASGTGCQAVQLTTIRTDFPQASQSRGEHGEVQVKVTIGNDGRALRTQVAHSSGFPALDKTATDSIAKLWRFDVTGCAPAELPGDSLVTVRFQRAPQHAVSGTVNTRRSTPVATNEQLPSHCDTTAKSFGDRVVACASIAPLAHSPQQSLAKHTESGAQQ